MFTPDSCMMHDEHLKGMDMSGETPDIKATAIIPDLTTLGEF